MVLATVLYDGYYEGLTANSKQGLPQSLKCLHSCVASRGQQISHGSISLGGKENAGVSVDGLPPAHRQWTRWTRFLLPPTSLPFDPQCLEVCPVSVLGSSPPKPKKHCQGMFWWGCRPGIGLRPAVYVCPIISKQHFNHINGGVGTGSGEEFWIQWELVSLLSQTPFLNSSCYLNFCLSSKYSQEPTGRTQGVPNLGTSTLDILSRPSLSYCDEVIALCYPVQKIIWKTFEIELPCTHGKQSSLLQWQKVSKL